MRACRDTFLHFLADNLTTLSVHAMRRDKDDPASGSLKMNAINVRFLKDRPDIQIGTTTVTIDVVYDDELPAIDAMNLVWGLLSKQFMTPKFDYSSGTAVAAGTNLFWHPHQVSFRQVYSDFYFHYTCTLALQHKPI